MKSAERYTVIGLMSGTSMDGLDLACCRFTKRNRWEFEIQNAKTVRYPAAWRRKLEKAHLLSAEDLFSLDSEYGNFMGASVADFIQKQGIRKIDLIASHGHTIFHQPQRGFTVQLGSGPALHAATGIPVVYDFRSLDVALGGQGAPLVPVGDRLLFGEYDGCLNLGGIANLSMEKVNKRIAFDIAFANMGLNYLARKNNMEFDRDGKIAAKGFVDTGLLTKIAAVYRATHNIRPSLSREGFELNLVPLLANESIALENRMVTFCESVADEIHRSLPSGKKKLRVLTTGGGALNPVLTDILREKIKDRASVVIPSREIIEFKEALVFGFLGVLRWRGEVNVLKTVTRARRDSCSGVIVGG